MDFDALGVGEEDDFAFTYAGRLASGETVLSAVWTIAAIDGTDEDAMDMMVGAPIIASPVTTQRLKGLVPNVQYAIYCLATTSDGRKLLKWALLWVRVRPEVT